MTPKLSPRPATGAEVRTHLVRALHADLVGPFALDTPNAPERLPLAPSRWYLTGFLAPEGGRQDDDPTAEDELEAGDDDDPPAEPATAEGAPRRRGLLPASIGLSVLLPPQADTVEVTLSFADYDLEEAASEASVPAGSTGAAPARPSWSPQKPQRWCRIPRGPYRLDLALDPATLREGFEVASTGLWLAGELAPAERPGLAAGTRALSLFVVNRRPAAPLGHADVAFAFQVRLQVACPHGLIPRPNVRRHGALDWDDRVADLQYRNRTEYAVGHGVSAETFATDGRVVSASTTWLPTATVRRVETAEFEDVETSMERIASFPAPADMRKAFAPMIERYASWIARQRLVDVGSIPRTETAQQLLDTAERAKKRIADGIDLLTEDPNTFAAFRLANQAMASAARQRSPKRYEEAVPRWRLFQLAFVLLNLRSLANDEHPDREAVELLFFPTGGGKTEAYLGAVAFVLLLRRLRHAKKPDGGLGIAVLLRYTLRLLTLDQLGRAATLICALEVLRRKDPQQLGEARFSIGLWVGRTATANTISEVARQIIEYRNNPSPNAASPFPLPRCPWCQTPFSKSSSFDLRPNASNPNEVVVACDNFRTCPFASSRDPAGIPVLFVDEQIYRELPSFLVATVDKFALLPWRSGIGKLFGRVQGRTSSGTRAEFFGSADDAPAGTAPLPTGLRPPELIIQDELHLISGPLGTMVGLYETAIDAMASLEEAERRLRRPKIIASTATVRRASNQVRALFGRTDMAVFPPPGIDADETFFAHVDHDAEGRLYLGVAAAGRAMKAILLRTYVALLAGAERGWDPRGSDPQPADPYMTLVGYFNSLRELGGMRRLVEDEISTRVGRIDERRALDIDGPHPWFARRALREPVELTSREKTTQVTSAKARLECAHAHADHVDVLLASNMISVGVDIDRLGLMVVAGQPKSTSEYIQASSRVGRDPKRPGLVVTVFNVHRPRDRSHYERFTSYHDSFYRFVEATSVTPFSAPSLDRGLAGLLVGMARHTHPELTPPSGVMSIHQHRQLAEAAAKLIAERVARTHRGSELSAKAQAAHVEARAHNLLDAWEALMKESAEEAAAARCYSPWDRNKHGKPLLFQVLEDPPTNKLEAKFAAPSSMRDVESSVHLWVARGVLGSAGHGA